MFQLEFKFTNLEEVILGLQRDFLNIDCKRLLIEAWPSIQPNITEILDENFERIQSMISGSSVATADYFGRKIADTGKGFGKIRGSKVAVQREVGSGRIKTVIYDTPLMATGTLRSAYILDDPYSFVRFRGGKQEGEIRFGVETEKFARSYPYYVQKWLEQNLGGSFRGFYSLSAEEQGKVHEIILRVVLEKLLGGTNAGE